MSFFHLSEKRLMEKRRIGKIPPARFLSDGKVAGGIDVDDELFSSVGKTSDGKVADEKSTCSISV
jgi:hypothetical protein